MVINILLTSILLQNEYEKVYCFCTTINSGQYGFKCTNTK